MSRPFAVRHLAPMGAAHVHIHYFHDDKAGDRTGYGHAHLVCHACNVATDVLYDFPRTVKAESPVLLELRNSFVAAHRHPLRHAARALGKSLCPPHYAIEDRLDLRRHGRWTHLLRWLGVR